MVFATPQIKAPKITTFKVPEGIAVATAVVAFTWYTYLAPFNTTSPFFIPANFVRSYVGFLPVQLSVGSIVLSHVLESLYTFSLCRKHSTGFLVGVRCSSSFFSRSVIHVPCHQAQYVITTLILGYPTWISLRKRIQAARIDSVMKVE